MSAPSNPNVIPDYAALPDLPLDDEGRATLTSEIWRMLVTGNDSIEDFLDISAEDYELTKEQLTVAYTSLREARLRQQTEIGDYRSRTQAAFEELNANGVVARANFTCCRPCATAEIGDERDDSRHWTGYIYFHSQDTDRLVEVGSTFVGYGGFEPENFDEDAYNQLSDQAKDDLYTSDVTRMLDEVVFPIVRRHGIEPEWNRDLGTRVLLTNADWYAPIES